MKAKASILAGLSSAVLLLAACGGSQQQGQAAAGAAQPPQSFPVFKVEKKNATINADYPATIEGQQNIEIRPKIDGYIEKIFIDEGSLVKKGQLLFTINAPQYAQEVNTAAAAISSAEADVNAAQLQVNKTRPLVEKDIISKFELESAELTLQSRKAALKQAKATLANAKTNLGYTTVTSPVNGVVGAIPYKLGSLITSTTAQPLTTVSNIGKVYVYFSMNEKDLLEFSRHYEGSNLDSKLKNLPPVDLILADGTSYPEKGHIETVNGLINTATGSAQLRATFANPKGLIRSGGSATVRLPQSVKEGILVPQKSTYELQGKRFVYVVDGAGKAKATEIKTMDAPSGQFFVVTDGLKGGETVVFDGLANMQDGMVIKPDTKAGEGAYSDLK
ncbi:efflux RND transporter periplasmic adaptor subunit [Mucilaginibacter conchicola]|uniref:Efflux RND transporter periplasmic adaptor subunit n=1 Tax=Mucilaginibacter conchicola TaxID=2303333 RepID=A0A372NRR8_9SPHI|nr:efflux RND transporter periplasmic adaptor subunit [Mucilaginibacter conchicola]RFZ90963.1 efflux RND transporter periplasmic adaptor subunit [Mucilaginibacter conchicola]